MEYPIPVKTGDPAPISPDWPRRWREKFNECPSRKLRFLAEKQPEAKRHYYLNAATFAEHSQTQQNWFEEDQPEEALLRMRPYNEVREETLAAAEEGHGVRSPPMTLSQVET